MDGRSREERARGQREEGSPPTSRGRYSGPSSRQSACDDLRLLSSDPYVKLRAWGDGPLDGASGSSAAAPAASRSAAATLHGASGCPHPTTTAAEDDADAAEPTGHSCVRLLDLNSTFFGACTTMVALCVCRR